MVVAALRLDERLRIRHAETEVIQRASAGKAVRFQRQDQGGIAQLEFGVVVSLLGRLDAEQGF